MLSVPVPPDEKNKLEKAYNAPVPAYEDVLELLSRHIRRVFSEKRIAVTVKHRVKEFNSWYAKVLRLAASAQAGEDTVLVTDVLGLRIVCPFLEEVELASDILRSLFHVREEEVKGSDYPVHFFGYDSIHFLVQVPKEFLDDRRLPEEFISNPVCEVQVRTILQEAWAEVEHELIYKADFSPLDEPLKRKLAAINANLTLSDIMFQEIRDYQKDLHTALRQRRKDFYMQLQQGTETSPPAGHQAPAEEPHPAPIPRETVDNLLLKGLTAHNRGNYDEAIRIYTGILQRDVRTDIRTVILTHRGMAYFSSGKSNEALKDFNRAMELDPKYTKARYYRAVHARTEGQYQQALEDLAECIHLDPYDPEYLTARAETYAAAGDVPASIAECKAVLRIAPDFKPAVNLLQELEKT